MTLSIFNKIIYVIENIRVVNPIMLMKHHHIEHHPNPMCYPDISLQKPHPLSIFYSIVY